MSQHVAIKCTYNNGGEGGYVGFHGTCSENVIKLNIDSGRIWCGNDDCACKKYYDAGFRGERPVDPCYESILFRDWEFGAGVYHRGERAGRPIRLSRVGEEKIAVLTTRFPGDQEVDRKIIGFFKINHFSENPGEETKIYADENYRIRLPLEEARELYFWDY